MWLPAPETRWGRTCTGEGAVREAGGGQGSEVRREVATFMGEFNASRDRRFFIKTEGGDVRRPAGGRV